LSDEFEAPAVFMILGRKNGLNKPFSIGRKMVDVSAGYSNLSILNELEDAIKVRPAY